MSVFSDIYNILNVSGVTTLVDDISPYVRGRGKGFPCVLFEIPNETFDRNSAGSYRSAAEVVIHCIDRSVEGAETVSDAVLDALNDSNCGFVESISREYEEGYDDDSVGLFTVSINYTHYSGV